MALITQTPILVDPVKFSRLTLYGQQSSVGGPFLCNGALYLVWITQDDSFPPYTGPNVLRVFKSTNKGLSWVEKDTAHVPDAEDPYIQCNVVGTTIYIYTTVTSGRDQDLAIPFDCTTDLFGTPSPAVQYLFGGAAIISAFNAGTGLFCYERGSDLWVFYVNIVRTSNKGLYYRKLSGGVWGAETALVTGLGTQTQLLASMIDSGTQDVTLFYGTGSGSDLTFITVDTAGAVVAGPTSTTLALGNFAQQFAPNVVDWIAGDAYLLLENTVHDVNVITGTPRSAPVWSRTAIDVTTGNFFPIKEFIDLDKDGNAVASWIVADTTSGATLFDNKIYMATNSGSGWPARTLVYDPVTNPPIVPGYIRQQGPHTLSFLQLSDGNWVFTTSIDLLKEPEEDIFPCAGFALITASPEISIACPVDPPTAIVGVPYDSGPPVVTGGTAPFHFEIVSGSLPPGFTLDPDTGDVTGITYSTGTFSYTLEVTDSGSPPLTAVVDAPCPITISGSSPTLPCEGITPHPETDNRFKLIKLVATMKPATHLPTRGGTQ